MYRYERDDLLCIFSTMNCEYQPKRLCDPKELSAEPQWLTSHSHRHTRRPADVPAHWSSFVAATSELPSLVYSSSTPALSNASSSSSLTGTSKTALCSVSLKRGLTHPSLTQLFNLLATHSSERIGYPICRTNRGVGGLAFSSARDGAATLMFSPPPVLQNLKL